MGEARGESPSSSWLWCSFGHKCLTVARGKPRESEDFGLTQGKNACFPDLPRSRLSESHSLCLYIHLSVFISGSQPSPTRADRSMVRKQGFGFFATPPAASAPSCWAWSGAAPPRVGDSWHPAVLRGQQPPWWDIGAGLHREEESTFGRFTPLLRPS